MADSISSSLVSTQRAFAAAIRNPRDAMAVAELFTSGRDAIERRLAIYRANTVATTSKALSAAYPVIGQLVGDEFFGGLARAYWQETPSASGDLGEYGAGFGDFLAAFPHVQEYPYMPDVARLEWAVHRASAVADGMRFDPAGLAAIPETEQGSVRVSFSPGISVVRSAYPIVRIWTVHQKEHAGDIAIDWESGETALVARDGLRVRVTAIDAGNAAAIESLRAGNTLIDAIETALAADPRFDAAIALSGWIAAGWIDGVSGG